VGRKWENIKRSKGKLDQARGATFSRITKDIMKAAKEGGADPEANFRLKLALQRAREANMPWENVERAIARATGQVEGVRYEELVYEGYGPGGVAIMMNIVTDNRNRTAGDVRHLFTKYGGNLGETGCVSWMFTKKGIVEIERASTQVTEDDLLMLVLDAGAEDLKTTEETFEITTDPDTLDDVLRALERAGIHASRAETAMIPNNTVDVTEENAEKLTKLLDALEEHDDIQNVYTNASFGDDA
jgi:YebC/PmpR family DNA-binding regulatory protein